jgi:uncharacterized protein (DUF2225 family)
MAKKIYYPKQYRCPFDGSEFTSYRLYPSARTKFERTDEIFDFPIFVNETGDENFVDFSLMEVKVCPTCYFASTDEEMFSPRFAEGLDRRTKEIMLNARPQREEIFKQAKNIFAVVRDIEDAIISYKLAILSSETLVSAYESFFAQELVRVGMYALKVSHLCKRSKPREYEKWMQTAFEGFKRASQLNLRGVLYYRTLYQLTALSVFFYEDSIAARSVETLMKLERSEGSKDVLKYLNRAKDIWQCRDLYRKDADKKT